MVALLRSLSWGSVGRLFHTMYGVSYLSLSLGQLLNRKSMMKNLMPAYSPVRGKPYAYTKIQNVSVKSASYVCVTDWIVYSHPHWYEHEQEIYIILHHITVYVMISEHVYYTLCNIWGKCVCVCVWQRILQWFILSESQCISVNMPRPFILTRSVYISYTSLCLWLYVCVRERERLKECPCTYQ